MFPPGFVEHLTHLLPERLWSEWFLKQRGSGLQDPLMGHRRTGVAGHIQDLEIRTSFVETVREVRPAASGHDDVGQQQVNHPIALFRYHQRLVQVARLQHRVAAEFQDFFRLGAERLGILDQQNRFHAGPLLGREGLPLRRLDVLVNRRQVDLERRTTARLAIDPDESMALLDDAVDRR
jgi:hypothetical protein